MHPADEARVLTLARSRPEGDRQSVVLNESPHAVTRVLAPGATGEGDDAWFVIPASDADGARVRLVTMPAPGAEAPGMVLAYRSLTPATAPAPPQGRVEVERATVTGNAFKVLFESPRAAAALLSIAGSRSVDVGPESERTWVVLAGRGLVFLQHDTTLPIKPGDVAIVPPGEPARLWARGPEDLHVLVLQPQAPPVKRRTLLTEVLRLRDKERNVSGAGF